MPKWVQVFLMAALLLLAAHVVAVALFATWTVKHERSAAPAPSAPMKHTAPPELAR